MRNLSTAERLIRKSKITHRLPKIHYWKRLIKEIKNRHNAQYWQCFNFYSQSAAYSSLKAR